MSNHNYSQYSSKKNKKNKVESVEAVEVLPVEPTETAEVEMVVETVETVELPAAVTGVVTNCVKLNVRVKPSIDADVACVLDAKATVTIDVDKSNSEWFKVTTDTGVDGYCMKKYVNASL